MSHVDNQKSNFVILKLIENNEEPIIACLYHQ